MAKQKEKLYQVDHGYHTICVGTLAQCQRVQSAIAACRCVKYEHFEIGDDFRSVFVLEETDLVVKKLNRELLTPDEYQRECTPKLGHTPAELVKGGVV